MAPKIDPAILQALSLDAATTTIASHGGSGFASTFKITSKGNDESEKLFFVKQGKGRESEIMFAGNSLSSCLTFKFTHFANSQLPTSTPSHDNRANQENTHPSTQSTP
jgi:hypothetical protein